MWQFKLLVSPIAQPADGGHAQAAAATFGQHTEPAAASDLMVPPRLSNDVSVAPQLPPAKFLYIPIWRTASFVRTYRGLRNHGASEFLSHCL